MAEAAHSALIGVGKVSRNVIWNLAGEVAPLLAAVVSIPLLIHGLGTERFGILSLAWALVGYLGIFDIGLGRALTKLAADRLATRTDEEEVRGLFWMAFVLMLMLSLVGGAAMATAARWLVYRELAIPAPLRTEALNAFYVLAFSLPILITASAFRGLLSALNRFDLVNLVRIPLGISMFVCPILVLPFSHSLVPAVAALLAVRLLGWLAYLFVCIQTVPGLARFDKPHFEFIRPLLGFGGWITVSSVVGPVMLYGDRFVIGAMLSTAAVAYYATPCDIVLRLSVLPTAVAGVLFPVFANSFAQPAPERAASLISRASNLILIAIFPAVLLIVTLAPEGLSLWLGRNFSAHSAVLVPWLAAGILTNSMAHLPYAMIQGAHRPEVTAKLHLIELPLYFLLLYWLTRRMGLEGAAIAWSLRLSADTIALWIAALNLLPRIRKITGYTLRILLAGLGVVAVGAILPHVVFLKGMFLGLTLPAFGLISWMFLLAPADRQRISIGLRSLYRVPV